VLTLTMNGSSSLQAPSPVLVFADFRTVGLLRTDDQCRDYDSVSAAINALPSRHRHDAMQVPLVHLASAPVDHKEEASGWAAHLVGEDRVGEDRVSDQYILVGSCSVLVRSSCTGCMPVWS
jgi:hypothetical protein